MERFGRRKQGIGRGIGGHQQPVSSGGVQLLRVAFHDGVAFVGGAAVARDRGARVPGCGECDGMFG